MTKAAIVIACATMVVGSYWLGGEDGYQMGYWQGRRASDWYWEAHLPISAGNQCWTTGTVTSTTATSGTTCSSQYGVCMCGNYWSQK